MSKPLIPVYSPSKHSFNILGDLRVDITVRHNPYSIPLDSMIAMAARKNKKRGFLFVSKILGKHIPVHPHVSLLSGAVLAAVLYLHITGQEHSHLQAMIQALIDPSKSKFAYSQLVQARTILPQPLLFIGFAETATAIGHSMFASFAGQAKYIHTTRERLEGWEPLITFEEEHSHATSHRLYARESNFLEGDEPIVLVDDEITTGKTALNIIADIHRKYPRRQYIVASLLDWRSEEDRERCKQLEQSLGIGIHFLSLISGEIEIFGRPVEQEHVEIVTPIITEESVMHTHVLTEYDHDDSAASYISATSVDISGMTNSTPYLSYTGRFGIHSQDNQCIETYCRSVGKRLARYRQGKRCLCLGTGEFMYIPMLIASEMGEGVLYHSTTRSPIHPHDSLEYGIRNAFQFKNPDDPEVRNFMYNIPSGGYDDVFLFMERASPEERIQSMTDILKQLGIPRIHLIICSG